jgi:PAS domain-containing protein
VWYAFRYGSALPPAIDWESAEAWATIDDERRFVEVSPALATIVEVPVEAMIGRPLEAFANADDPNVRADLVALWTEFGRIGVAGGTVRFNYGDGRPRQLAYRIVANDPVDGRHRLTVRAVVPPDDAPA